MVVRSFLSRSVEWLGCGRLLPGATALLAVTLGIIPLLRHFWPLIVVSGFMGASLGFTQPLTMSLMVESVSAEFWGVAFGIRQGAQRIGFYSSTTAYQFRASSLLLRLLAFHTLPNVIPLIVIMGILDVGLAILLESTLSFLGLAVQAPNPSWGLILGSGRAYVLQWPHIAAFPGIAITLSVLGFNLPWGRSPRCVGPEGELADAREVKLTRFRMRFIIPPGFAGGGVPFAQVMT